MIERYLTKNLTVRKDMEDWLLWHTLEHEYSKPYSGQPFGINKNTTLELVEESEYKRLKELLNQMNINDNRSQQVL